VGFSESELVYGRAGDMDLAGVLYRPEGDGSGPILIDVHGGAWSSGNLRSGRFYDRKLAEAGFTVLAIEFRFGPDFQHPAASADIAAAVRFVKGGLGIPYTSLGLVGSSSGGHLALYTGLLPDIPAHKTTAVVDDNASSSEISASVDFVIGLWPVSNPIARYQYVLAREQQGEETWGPHFTPDRLAQGHRAYFVTQSAMTEASIPGLLAARKHQHLPAVFIVQPELDLNVPPFINQTLHGALIDSGANVKYKLYPDVAHGFAQADGPQTDTCIADMIDFIRSQ
jgi:acetyl esterase